jgi:NAD(P)-dependent dehydrogenase (short-subunit alcohol dehydrogenase family)
LAARLKLPCAATATKYRKWRNSKACAGYNQKYERGKKHGIGQAASPGLDSAQRANDVWLETGKETMNPSDTQKLKGKVALVTGGSSGLGLATAKRFAAEGAAVVISGRRQPELDRAAREIGNDVLAVRADISQPADLDRLFAAIKERHGRLDVLFANAGVGSFAPLGDITEAHFDAIFDVNVKGTLFTVQKALALLQPGSAIVLNASMVSIKGMPAFGVYAASKAALRSFARTWALDLKARQIRVNVVSPGTIITPGYKNELGLDDAMIRQFEETTAATAPSGRTGTPDEVAKAVLFLASDDSSYVNGVELFVDGGSAQI